jgi:hypothetical protein
MNIVYLYFIYKKHQDGLTDFVGKIGKGNITRIQSYKTYYGSNHLACYKLPYCDNKMAYRAESIIKHYMVSKNYIKYHRSGYKSELLSIPYQESDTISSLVIRYREICTDIIRVMSAIYEFTRLKVEAITWYIPLKKYIPPPSKYERIHTIDKMLVHVLFLYGGCNEIKPEKHTLSYPHKRKREQLIMTVKRLCTHLRAPFSERNIWKTLTLLFKALFIPSVRQTVHGDKNGDRIYKYHLDMTDWVYLRE